MRALELKVVPTAAPSRKLDPAAFQRALSRLANYAYDEHDLRQNGLSEVADRLASIRQALSVELGCYCKHCGRPLADCAESICEGAQEERRRWEEEIPL